MTAQEEVLLEQCKFGNATALENYVWDETCLSRDFFDQAVAIGEETQNGRLLSGLSEAVKENRLCADINSDEYLRLSELASDFGDKDSSEQLGWDYLACHNWEKAYTYFVKAEEQGASRADLANYVGCHPLVPGDADSTPTLIHFELGGTNDLCPKVFSLDWWLFVLKRKPTPILQYLLGVWYWDANEGENEFWGRNTSLDKARAIELFEQSADGKCPLAMLKLSEIYMSGQFANKYKCLLRLHQAEQFDAFRESVNFLREKLE